MNNTTPVEQLSRLLKRQRQGNRLSPRTNCASRAIRYMLHSRSKGVAIMTDEDPKEKGFFNRPRKGGKSLWDWLQLLAALAIPVAIFLGTTWFSYQLNQTSLQFSERQHQNDLKIAQDNRQNDLKIANDQQQEATLKAYLDDMTTLLLDKKLGSQATADQTISAEAAVIARSKTIIALSRLVDPQRKATIVQFLHGAQLIGCYECSNHYKHPIIFSMTGADLRGAGLERTDLRGVHLEGANLQDADLRSADLRGADLNCYMLSNCTNLSGANLSGVNLSGAFLGNANLKRAILSNANLTSADLSGADLLRTHLYSIHLDGAIVKGAYLSSFDPSSEDLCAAVKCTELRASGAYVYPDGLVRADLHGAPLDGAQLTNVDLTNANLSSTDLRGANLSEDNLSGTNMLGASYNTKIQTIDKQGNPLTIEPTQWPQGFNPTVAGTIC